MTDSSPRKIALIIGITGQDGTFCKELLLSKGYEVVGTTRSIKDAYIKIPSLQSDVVKLAEWDLLNYEKIRLIIDKFSPSEIYNFAGMTYGGARLFDDPILMSEINGLAIVRILEAIKEVNPRIKFSQASSSEMFGRKKDLIVNEDSPLDAASPYAAAKIFAHSMIAIYRNNFDIHACSAILFNHESSLRSRDFVSRKITSTVAQIKMGLQDELLLGNIEASRDWLYAGDSVKAMWMMLNADKACDFVVSSGLSHSLKDFCDIAFNYVGLNYRDYVKTSADLYRKNDDVVIVGDNSRLIGIGWRPSLNFKEMVEMMVESDLLRLKHK